jgi:putative ABC transport system substrate-binding protein
MILLCKRLGLGIGLIVLASGILLGTDRDRRSANDGTKRVAILQHASNSVLDEGLEGALVGLAEKGFRVGKNLRLERYNAHGDVALASATAREILHGPFDMVFTLSTCSLQAVAAANKDRHMLHVFGLVADPFAAGVGLDRDHPDRHPPYMVGHQTGLPVDESFRLARQCNPGLKNVGVVWNPSESNSLAFTTDARKVCGPMGITLLEANVESSAGVLEATHAVIGRGAQAIWVGGDLSVSMAIDSVIGAAQKAGIPVFSITPGKPDRGTLFDGGINFYECGKVTGALAGDILNGTDPATIPIRDLRDIVPRRLIVNRLALKGLKENWRLPDEVVRRADIVVDAEGIHKAKSSK